MHRMLCNKFKMKAIHDVDRVMQMCWSRFGNFSSTSLIIDTLLDMMDRSLPFDEKLKRKGKPKEGSDKTCTTWSLAVSAYTILPPLKVFR